MGTFDNTEGEYIQRKIEETIQMPEIGRVVSVEEHTSPDDNSNFEASVILRDEDYERRHVPISTVSRGTIDIPRQDDIVLVQFLDGSDNRPIITRVLYTDVNRAPLGEEGLYRRKAGNLYIEMDADGNYARLSKKPEDDSTGTDISASVEIDDSTGTPNISIETDGDISISAGGNVVIDQGGTAKKVLTEDAKFEYEDTTIEDTGDGSGTASSTTKTTTTVSNNETTETEIE